jgi:hypothetical protein
MGGLILSRHSFMPGILRSNNRSGGQPSQFAAFCTGFEADVKVDVSQALEEAIKLATERIKNNAK